MFLKVKITISNCMKSLLYFLLFVPSLVLAQIVTIPKPVQCGEARLILSYLTEEFEEKPYQMLKTDNETTIGLLTNQKTKTWTLVEFNSQIACILSTGRDFDSKTLNVMMRQRNSTM